VAQIRLSLIQDYVFKTSASTIIRFLLKRGGSARLSDIARGTGLSYFTVKYHVEKLCSLGLVQVDESEGVKVVKLADIDYARKLLKA